MLLMIPSSMVLSILIDDYYMLIIINLEVLIGYHYMINLMNDYYELINVYLNHLHIRFPLIVNS